MFNFLFTHTPLLYFTQSVWRDEAFSILVAEKPLISFIGQLNFEPPVYYILLHFWIKLFGTSEIAARSLSLVGFTLATVVVIFWAEKLFKKHWLSWFLPIFFFFNPMLLYYAFEIRAYGWLMFFSTLSLYAFSEKKYKLLAVANILAFYTHSYAIFIPVVQTLFYFWIQRKEKKNFQLKRIFKNTFFQTLAVTCIAIAPWMMIIIKEILKLRQTWYFPVDLQLVLSVVGNMFIGYDGTPGGLWAATAILSAILVGFFIFANRHRQHSTNEQFLLFTITLPLVMVIGISFIKPLFVNRYLIYVTIAEVLLLALAISHIKKPLLQKITAAGLFCFVILVNLFFPSYKAKLDIRAIVLEANALRGPNDILFVSSPLIFFETEYYTPDRQHVYLYNPQHNPFPWYVGEQAFSQSQMAYDLPEYPMRALIIGEDRSITMEYKTKSTAITQKK